MVTLFIQFVGAACLLLALTLSVHAQPAPQPSDARTEGKGMFSEKERAYLKSQRLARIATVSKTMQPDVAPVSFEFDGEYFYIGGRNNPATMKYRNVERGNRKVALVFDDWESLEPWRPRSIKIHGIAELVTRKGHLGEGVYLRIVPQVKWSMGVNEPAFQNGKPVIKKTTR